MAKNFIKLGSDPKRVEFTGEFILENEFIYEFFNGKKATEYDATFERPGCVQLCTEDEPPHICPSTTSEDCLYLNVWAPHPMPKNSPVMVSGF